MSSAQESATVLDLAAARLEEERRQKFAQIDAQLAKNAKGVTLGIVSNLILIIGSDPVLAKLLGFNEFTLTPVIHAPPPAPLADSAIMPGPYPRTWTGADISHLQSYIQRVWTRMAHAGDVEAAMMAVAVLRRFHPPRDWLGSLRYDGRPRLNTWLTKAFGAPGDEYHAAVGAKFMIAAVRRVRQPGCKFDYMPILEGLQGIGKSKTLRTLFSPAWFTDSLPAVLQSADAALGLQGAWVVELGEIEQIIRNEVEIIKAFLSRSVDRFRAPYGRSFQTYPRQSVMIGTTNQDGYLRDSTGNRRFWPVACTHADEDWVGTNREQLFAEAAAREASGEDHWMHDGDLTRSATEHQSERMMEDVWEDRILPALWGMHSITVGALLTDQLQVPIERQGKREQMRVASILRKAGFKRELKREGKDVVRRWIRDKDT